MMEFYSSVDADIHRLVRFRYLPGSSGEKDTSTSFLWRAIFSKWQHGGSQDTRNPRKENRVDMGLLDAIIGRYFRDEEAGRVVAFPVDRRIRAYVVRSESEEQKIRAFLKMYYCAEWSLQLVSLLLTIWWITELTYASENSRAHFLRTGAIFLGIYSLIVALPYFLLWRTFKTALLSFVSPQDEVVVSGKRPGQQQVLLAAGLIVFAVVILLGLILLTRAK